MCAGLLYDADGDHTPGERVWRQLSFIDRRHQRGRPLDDTVLWTLLLLEAMKESCEGQRDRVGAVSDFLDLLIERLAITRRCADGMRRIVGSLPRIQSGRASRHMRSETFPLALDVAEADRAASGQSIHPITALRAAYESRLHNSSRKKR